MLMDGQSAMPLGWISQFFGPRCWTHFVGRIIEIMQYIVIYYHVYLWADSNYSELVYLVKIQQPDTVVA